LEIIKQGSRITLADATCFQRSHENYVKAWQARKLKHGKTNTPNELALHAKSVTNNCLLGAVYTQHFHNFVFSTTYKGMQTVFVNVQNKRRNNHNRQH